jgi:hypothetical protein
MTSPNALPGVGWTDATQPYLRSLQDMKLILSREMDRVQVGEDSARSTLTQAMCDILITNVEYAFAVRERRESVESHGSGT